MCMFVAPGDVCRARAPSWWLPRVKCVNTRVADRRALSHRFAQHGNTQHLAAATMTQPKASRRAMADLLGMMLGEGVLPALTAFVQGGEGADPRPLLALLVGKTARRAVADLATAAFGHAGGKGRDDIVSLLIGVDGAAATKRAAMVAGRDAGRPLVPGLVVPAPEYEQVWVDVEDTGFERGVYTHQQPPNRVPALNAAADAADAATVRALLAQRRVDPNEFEPEGENGSQYRTALHSALEPNNVTTDREDDKSAEKLECVKALLAAEGIDVNLASTAGRTGESTGWAPVHFAADTGDVDCMRALLAAPGIDVNRPGTLGSERLDEVYFGDQHTDGNDYTAIQGKTALDVASIKCHEIMRDYCRFAGPGSDGTRQATKRGRYIFSAAAYHLHNSESRPRTYNGFRAVVRALAVAKDVHINHRSGITSGYPRSTALHWCCRSQDPELAADLLLAGSCRFARDYQGFTPLDRALYKGPDAAAKKRLPPLGAPRHSEGHCKCKSHAKTLKKARKKLKAVFLSGIDYWQLRHHSRHAWAMKEVVTTLLLIDQRLDAVAEQLAPGTPATLPYLPKDLWLATLGFVRSADFGPALVWTRE